MADQYAEIEIRIHPKDQDGVYPVEAELDDGSFFGGEALKVDEQGLLMAQLDPQSYGLLLFKALFSGEILRAYDQANGRAAGGRVRVRLRIDDGAPELHTLFWERLYHIHKGQVVPLAASGRTPFSRFSALPIEMYQPIGELPVRLLFAISNPRNLPEGLGQLDVANEVRNLIEAIGDLQASGQVQVTLLPGRTGLPSDLQEEIKQDGYQIETGVTDLNNIVRHLQDQHIFHFLGHGRFKPGDNQEEGTAYLYLEQEDGSWHVVEDTEVRQKLISTDPGPHLVFMAACESAVRGEEITHPFVGLAPKLVQAGVPAVVAMQDFLPMETARQLTSDFYRSLLRQGVVDQALNEARNLLFEGDEFDWAIPVLFMRLEDGRLYVADPIRATLRTIHRWGESDFLPMPMEVVHLIGPQDPGSLERVEQEMIPTMEVVDAVLNIFTESPVEGGYSRKTGTKLVVLVGQHGMARTTQFKRIARETAERSLVAGAGDQIIPLYVDLASFGQVRGGVHNPVELIALDSLRAFWPDLGARSLADVPRRDHGLRLRFLFDGSDDLIDRDRREAWRKIKVLMKKYPDDEYMLVVDADHFNPRSLEHSTDLLVVQRLSRRTIEKFLIDPGNAPFGSRLFDALTRNQLFDLASIPWMLVRLLGQAEEGIYPSSRAMVLENLVEDAVADIPSSHGMRARAKQTLYNLARTMQFSRQVALSARKSFEIMAEVRENREYHLEQLADELVDSGLMVRIGDEGLRFTYPEVRYYCCAQAILQDPKRDPLLDEITASLGRIIPLRWWEGTLILMSGLMSKPRVLHRKLLYGARLSEGEEVFLAVRCLQESRAKVEPSVESQVAYALMQQLDSASVLRTAQRDRAVHALGQLRNPSAIPTLARIANQRIREDWEGKPAYEFSSTRMVATIALQRLFKQFEAEIYAADPNLVEMLRYWQEGNVTALNDHLLSGESGSRAIAAFALGHLRSDAAVESLRKAALDPYTQSDVRWAVTDGLVLLDPDWVTQQIIIPLVVAKNSGWYERLAYLIGKIRAQDPVALEFLERCLDEYARVSIKRKAIQSLGWLYDRSKKSLFESIAMGRFEEIKEQFRLGKASTADRQKLRREAIDALAFIGDDVTLNLLREAHLDWDPELRRAAYQASEEIYWREGFSQQD